MLSPPIILLLIFIGFLSGILAGMLGIGGGILMNPVCFILYPYININPAILSHTVFGTNFFVVSFVSLFTTFRFHLRKLVLWRGVFPIAVFSIFGAFSGSMVTAQIESNTLQRMFGLVVLFSAVRMFHEIESQEDRSPNFNILALGFIGLSGGFISGLVGVGGGILTIPVMALLLHFPINKIPGTSSGIIFFTVLSAMIGYIITGWNEPLNSAYSIGYVYLPSGIPLAAGALIGVPVGTWVNSKVSTRRIRQFFGIVLVIAFIKMTFLPG